MASKMSVVMLSVAFLAAGCATSTEIYMPPPGSGGVTNSKVVQKPFEHVWDQLVRQLSSDFFVINNIDKSSRLINLSFSAQRPSEYVDCGQTNRSFTNAHGTRNYSYNTADSATFAFANQQGHVFNLNRRSRLEGRTNIYVAPEGPGTLVTVNTKYILNIDVEAFGLDGRPAGRQSFVADVSTKTPGGYQDIQCYARGVIEQRILSFVDN